MKYLTATLHLTAITALCAASYVCLETSSAIRRVSSKSDQLLESCSSATSQFRDTLLSAQTLVRKVENEIGKFKFRAQSDYDTAASGTVSVGDSGVVIDVLTERSKSSFPALPTSRDCK
jgi:hypothetical protein